MELVRAKRIVAEYITGGHVRSEELREAIEAVQSDPEYVDYLRSQMGARGWVSPCEIFQSRLDEFAEMSPEQRQREMPESSDHLRACSICQKTYWDAQPLWIVQPDLAQSSPLGEQAKLLATPVSVARGPLGQIIYRLGLPPQQQHVSAAAAGVSMAGQPATDIGRRREWILPDEESGMVMSMQLEAMEDGNFSIGWALELENGEPVDPHTMRIHVKDRVQGRVFASGPLSDFQSRISLPVGRWTVRLSSTAGGAEQTWEIPLDLERENDE